ncbi:nuclear transport factor 2 family protein [Phyllobacterium sp. LjRoot231]|uniref:YybH family protein n=1 Tax=Phyllobacterium sp. LjRoot231 TaxID=3342289 RepID=UPI003ECD512B
MIDEFKMFIERRKIVAQAYVNGDAEPLTKIAIKNSAATFFGPMGGVVEGAAEVMSRYESDARSFDTGSESDLEIVHMSANGEIGYWAGFQNAKARLKGRTETIPMRLRVTEIFRKSEGEWRLIHRHADPLSKEK